MIINEKKLKLYIENNLNVLFEGERGVGKTATIKKAFETFGYRVKYFSASTMDPWTDLVGVPTTVTRNDGKEVLRMVMPEDFVDDKFDVIFIDELNRAPKKVKDALMEIIQFKTINGKPYNIKMVWAAMNPYKAEDDKLGQDYDVEPLDPALEDRFQVKVKFPYKVDEEFFKENYGSVGAIFAQWWKNQPEEIKHEISPRRLSYAAEYYPKGVDIEDIISFGNISKLKEMLVSANQLLVLENDMKSGIISSASKALLQKNYNETIYNFITGKKELTFFFNELSDEWLAKECVNQSKVLDNIIAFSNNKSSPNHKKAFDVLQGVISINPKSNFVKRNFEQLKDFIPQDIIDELNSKKLLTGKYLTTNNTEAKMIKNVNYFDQSWHKEGMKLIASTLKSKYINKNSFHYLNNDFNAIPTKTEKEQAKDLLSFHYAAMLSFFFATNKETELSKAIKDQMFNRKHPKFIFNSSLPNLINFNDKIEEKMEYFKGMTGEEIANVFNEAVKAPRKTKSIKV